MDSLTLSFLEQVELRPDATAVASGGRQLSYAQLEQQSRRAGRSLEEKGIKTLGHLGRAGVDLVVSLLAAHRVGATFVALDSASPDAAVSELAQRTRLDRVRCDRALVSRGRDLFGKRLEVDAEEELLTTPPADRHWKPVQVPQTRASHMRFTSGSVGTSKVVVLSRRHVERMLPVFDRFVAPTPDQRIALLGQFWPLVIFRALTTGASLHSIDFRTAGVGATRDWMRSEAVTALFSYPQAFRQIFSRDDVFDALTYLHLSGDVLSVDDLIQFEASVPLGARLHNSYGSSEFPWMAAFVHVAGQTKPETVPLGKPLPCGRLLLLKEDGSSCGVAEPGEIVIRSDDLADGYLDDQEATDITFRESPDGPGLRQYHTGDLAEWTSDGHLLPRGRKDDQVKVRGNRVSPVDVERVAQRCPGVAECAAVSFTDRSGSPQLALHFVPDRPGAVTNASLREYLRTHLAGGIAPKAFIERSALPRTATGKILRRELSLEQIEPVVPPARDRGALPGVTPLSETEALLHGIWSEVLSLPTVDPDGPFEELGGDSLGASRMLAEVEARTGRRIPFETLSLAGGTIRGLAAWIDGDTPAGSPVILRRGTGPETIVVTHVKGGHLSDYVPLLDSLAPGASIVGFHPRGLRPDSAPDWSVAAMASHGLESISSLPAAEPPVLAGHSYGALIAYEMARQAQAGGLPLGGLILIDPPTHCTRPLRTLRWCAAPLLKRDPSEAWARLTRLLPHGANERDLDRAHERAALRYRPGKGPTVRTLLLLASDTRFRASWARRIDPQPTVVPLPFPHEELLSSQGSSRAVEEINAWLNPAT